MEDLTRLGSGIHYPVTELPHATLPDNSPKNTERYTVGDACLAHTIIMHYTAVRSEGKPIVDTTTIDYHQTVYQQSLVHNRDYA